MTRSPLLSVMPSWFLALTAALFLALGPAVAPILSASARNTSHIEICTAFGLVKKAVSGDFTPQKTNPTQEHKQAQSHCLFCHLRKIAGLVLPPQLLSVPAIEPASIIVLYFTAQSHCLACGYKLQNPRGPPVFLT